MRHHVNRDRFYPDHLHEADLRDGAPVCTTCGLAIIEDDCACVTCQNCGDKMIAGVYCAACRRDPTCLGYEQPITLPVPTAADFERLFGRAS